VPYSEHPIQAEVKRVLENHRMLYPVVYKPSYSVKVGNSALELWVAHRRLPMLLTAGGIIVPVSPNLKMVTGVAKYVRDIGADLAQYDANRVAPLPPGEAFITSGAKYRFKYTALAVVFDEQMRTDASIVRRAVRNAVAGLAQKGCSTIILPDFTDNLVPQPNQLPRDVYRATAVATAATLVSAAQSCAGMASRIRIWTWNPISTEIYRRELQRIERAGH
jgi:hypothetical protein